MQVYRDKEDEKAKQRMGAMETLCSELAAARTYSAPCLPVKRS
jgi:hypothetical protein